MKNDKEKEEKVEKFKQSIEKFAEENGLTGMMLVHTKAHTPTELEQGFALMGTEEHLFCGMAAMFQKDPKIKKLFKDIISFSDDCDKAGIAHDIKGFKKETSSMVPMFINPKNIGEA